MRTLPVTLTVSVLMTGEPSASIDAVSTGGLAALGVQFSVEWGNSDYSGKSFHLLILSTEFLRASST